MYTRDTFNLKDRIVGASRHSIHIKDDNGGIIFCHNKIFGQIMSNPHIGFDIQALPAHEDHRTGRMYPETKWIVAYLPTRF